MRAALRRSCGYTCPTAGSAFIGEKSVREAS